MSDELARELRAYARCCLDDTQGESPHRDVSNIIGRAPAAKMQGVGAMMRFNQNLAEWDAMDHETRERFWRTWRNVMPPKLRAGAGRSDV